MFNRCRAVSAEEDGKSKWGSFSLERSVLASPPNDQSKYSQIIVRMRRYIAAFDSFHRTVRWLVAAAALSLICYSSSFTATIPSMLPRPSSLHADQGLVVEDQDDHSSSRVFIPGETLSSSYFLLLISAMF